jgi:CRISPR-associated protein Cas1
MALHALLYCERLFYLEEVEEIRVADAAVYAGRELHAGLEASEGENAETFELSSTAIGIFGKVDAVRRRDGSYVPYEHKRGRCRRDDDNTALAWPTDRVQAAAYGMMLEEALGRSVPEVRVHYHVDNVTVRLPLDETTRSDVRAAVERARALRRSIERPPITDNEKLCRRCSLAPVCLPEEVRQDEDPSHAPVRLFPPDDQRGTLHVVSPSATVGRSGDRLIIRYPDAPQSAHPSREISAVLLHGFAQMSTQAIRLCRDNDIAVHWLTASGGHIASLTSSVGQVQRRLRQYQALADPATSLRLAKQLARGRIEGQHRYLLRATRGDAGGRAPILSHLHAISTHLGALDSSSDVDSLRGHEGDAAAHYFASINTLLSSSVTDELRYAGRTRRPPLDRFSALLNFGYGLLHTAVMRAVLAVGLEPALGFYHTPRSAAHPLVLDLMELFRVPVWDLVVVGSLNRGQWDPGTDFTATKSKVWLSDEGRRKAIGLFEARLGETWKHPVVNYSLSYARTIELEARLLEKEWTGEPGLFARMRLR